MLKKVFEHKVLAEKDGERPTPRQIRAGLVYYFTHPKEFIPHIQDAAITDLTSCVSEPLFSRTINFGPVEVEDTVTFEADDSVHVKVKPGSNFPEAALEIKPSLSFDGKNYLSFTYFEDDVRDLEKEFPEGANLRKAAWEAQDRQIVKRICEMAAEGKFDTLQ